MKKDMLQGHRSRLRKKFLTSGLTALHDYETLEMLLTFVIPRRDVKPIAKALLLQFKELHAVFDASPEEFRKLKALVKIQLFYLFFCVNCVTVIWNQKLSERILSILPKA